MSNSDKIRKRLNQAELDISRLKANVKNMDNIVSAGGPIDKGFELILSEFDEVREELSQVREELNQRVDSLDEKLDTILSHITGIDKSNNE